MSDYQTELKNITDAFSHNDVFGAVEIFMQCYGHTPVEKFMECAKVDDFESPSEMIEYIDDMIFTLKLAKELIEFHYKL